MRTNIDEATRALTEKPLLATSAERILILNEIKSKWNDQPQPIRFANTLTSLLERVSVPLEPHDLIAGRCVDRLLTEEEEQIFQDFLRHPDYTCRETFLGSGHCTYSWEAVVELGLPGLEALAQQSLDDLRAQVDMQPLDDLQPRTDMQPLDTNTSDKTIFLTSTLQIYRALRSYILRYSKAAREKGMTGLAETLEEAATQKPCHFRSALQLLWIVALVDCAYITPNPTLTLGRLDQILYPLYLADLEAGILTRDEAISYITDYYCKHNLIMGRGEHQVGDAQNSTTFERICCFDAPQYLLLGGTDANGQPVINELTLLFAQCLQPSFKNPVAVVRYFPGMDSQYPELWQILTEKALQSASLMFYNDSNVLRTFQRIGIPLEDCHNYAHFGCNWPSTGDNSSWMWGGPSASKYHAFLSEEEKQALDIPYMRTNTPYGWPDDFMIVMRRLAETENPSMEDFYTGFLARAEEFTERKLRTLSRELEVRRRRPAALLTYGDCFLTDSIRNAHCVSAGAKYHFEFQSFQMFATVVDCFTVVEQLVFLEKKLTLQQLLAAVDANFDGYDAILALCRTVEKFGSDSECSNYHAARLSSAFSRIVIEKSGPWLQKEGLFLAPCMQSDTWHLKLGRQYGATPDGRLAHMPFSQNSRPNNGSCTNDITGLFRSMLQIPSDSLLSGALNLDVDPRQFSGENGHRIFAALLGSYFNQGGLHAQVTSVNVDDLIDAQKNPQLHRDLRVRITGYSGVFVDICKELQDDIIARLKQ